jgi:hypothetical protein
MLTKKQSKAWDRIERLVRSYEDGKVKARQLVKKVSQINEKLDFSGDEALFEYYEDTPMVIEFLATQTRMGKHDHDDRTTHANLKSAYRRNVYWGE